MSDNSNPDLSQTLYIKDYVSFIKNNKLEDCISQYLMNLYSFNMAVPKYFAHLSQEQAVENARITILKLLKGIESGIAIEEVKQNLANFKNNEVSGIPANAVKLQDITLIYSAQKLALLSFLPYYTKDVSAATQVVSEVEQYYRQVQQMAVEVLETIQHEEYEKRLESEEKYRNLFDNSSDLIHIADEDGLILYVNNAWTTTLGYGTEELQNKRIYDFIKPSEVANYKAGREDVLCIANKAKSIRTIFVKKDSGEITVEGFISCQHKNGISIYTQAVLHDITERLQQENQIQFYISQLAEREENLRDIIDNAPDAVIVIDKESTILLWNPKAEEIFGWGKSEVTGKRMTDIIVPATHRQLHENGLKRYLFTRQPTIMHHTIEVPALHKKGHEFFISLTISHSTQNGKDTFIAFLRDITEQKENELELENKRKQLEKSNQELEQYAWLASHDLKEPLRKILTFSDALLRKHESGLPDQTFTYLEKIHSSATRMGRLIEAVLQYSNVAADHDLFVTTDLNKILDEVLDDLEIMIVSKKATIHRSALPEIEAIPIQMRQLLQNLISNGIKYSKANEPPVITISCDEEKDGYKIAVKDNGIGFEAMYAEKVFQVFQRLLHKKTYEGTGIGLALCKRIAEAHKGSIYAESELGKGSSFFISLPAKHSPASSPVV